MSEQRQHNGFVPLRVRFRAHGEQTRVAGERLQWQRGHLKTAHGADGEAQAQAPIIQIPAESQQHTRQVKELIRLGNILRAELGLDEVLQHIAASISTCTGFRTSVIKLLEEGSEHLKAVAFAGVAAEDERMLREHPMRVEQMLRQMQPDFRISQSYFISHEHMHLFADVPMVTNIPLDDYEPGGWHPMDMLIVPLYSPRQKKLVGFLSLDDPEDKKVPTLERIEVVELFAQQAALAIDNARIFQEREAEHQALEEGISSLTQDLEQMQRGDLRVRVRPSHEKLQPIADAVNSMVEEISGILADVQVVTRAVDEHTHDVQRSSDLLVRDADHQERQVY
ncbi:MAG: GAF domain-containing protein, partial [Ktedonobacteraceae bacterium]|nr:GAF domain-containing protein [Ktedonobacteraceae bacterium]